MNSRRNEVIRDVIFVTKGSTLIDLRGNTIAVKIASVVSANVEIGEAKNPKT